MYPSSNQTPDSYPDRNRLKVLVHYIVDAVPGAVLDKLRINRILWFVEREIYLRTGSTFSGESFIKAVDGPMSRHLADVLVELEQEQKIVSRRARVLDCARDEYLSLVSPDISLFSTEVLDIIARQITKVLSLSGASHVLTPEQVDLGEEIPMYSLLAVTRPPTPEDLAWAMSDDQLLFASAASEQRA